MSKIEWLHRPGTKAEVWNPVTGCTKVSEGCRHCYAERQAERFWSTQYPTVSISRGLDDLGVQRPRKFTDVQCHEDRLFLPLRWKKPRTVFVNSMSDLFHDAVPDAFVDRVFAVMQAAKSHTFIVLTKRPGNMQAYLSSDGRPHQVDAAQVVNLNAPGFPLDGVPCLVQDHLGRVDGWPLPNVWLGVSVEDQRTADERVYVLLNTPAAVHVISAEPLLEPIDFGDRPVDTESDTGGTFNWLDLGIDWLIVGGESGPQARPCDVAWIRSLKDQAQAAGVPCFVKQLGANPVDPTEDGRYDTWGPVHDRKGGDPSEWPDDLRVREWPEAAQIRRPA